MHNWYACSHARPTFCNVCKDSLSGVTSHGLSCEGRWRTQTPRMLTVKHVSAVICWFVFFDTYTHSVFLRNTLLIRGLLKQLSLISAPNYWLIDGLPTLCLKIRHTVVLQQIIWNCKLAGVGPLGRYTTMLRKDLWVIKERKLCPSGADWIYRNQHESLKGSGLWSGMPIKLLACSRGGEKSYSWTAINATQAYECMSVSIHMLLCHAVC